jgi:hypothetical protein
MTQTYPLTITRNRGYYGKIRKLALYAKTPSGKVKLGSVKQGQSITVNVPQDATQIYGKMDWCKSVPMDLTFINGGETVYANLWFTLNPLRLIGIPTMPCAIESRPR